MFQKLLIGSLSAAFLISTVCAETGDETKDVKKLQKEASQLDNSASQSSGSQVVFESLSKQLNVPVATLQQEQQNTKFGFGQLFIANSLAQATGKTFDQVAQEFNSGKGWGQIANENNVRLGQVVSNLKRANQELRHTENQLRNEQNQSTRANGNQSVTPSQPRGAMGGPAVGSQGRGPRR